MSRGFRFHGCMPANLLPFTADLALDESAYRAHLRWLADTPGVTGIVANGHAAEVASLDREERKRTLGIALDEVAGKMPVVSGVYSDGTLEAVDLARDAQAAGAAGLLVFPPTLFMWGAQLKPDMVLRHFQTIADAVDLPIVVFEYPPASGIGYAPETLARLCEISQVAAVKDWSNDIVAFERNLRAIRETGRPVAVLSSFTMSLMASFLLGADGAHDAGGVCRGHPALRRRRLARSLSLPRRRIRPLAAARCAPPRCSSISGRATNWMSSPFVSRDGMTRGRRFRPACACTSSICHTIRKRLQPGRCATWRGPAAPCPLSSIVSADSRTR